MKTTIDMAREVKATAYTNRHYPDRTTYTFGPEQLEAFEALVRADEREQGQKWFEAVTAQHKQEILAEREACAKVAEDSDHVVDGRTYYDQLGDANATARNIVAAIRARSKP
jgi:hypothetical protein